MTKLAKRTKPEPLTEGERGQLRADESIIERCKDSFFDMAFALKNIRDKRLYRAKYRTFEEYLADRWGFNRRYASMMITGAVAGAELRTVVTKRAGVVNVEPTSERQVRPIKTLPESQRKEAWDRAVRKAGGTVPSERQVREIVIEMKASKTAILAEKGACHCPPMVDSEAAQRSLKVNNRPLVERALELLKSIPQPTKNISAAIEFLSKEIDGGADQHSHGKTHE